jgi:hypothetical protein
LPGHNDAIVKERNAEHEQARTVCTGHRYREAAASLNFVAANLASSRVSRGTNQVFIHLQALQQTHAQLPEPLRTRLSATLQELPRLVARIRSLLVEVARRAPPGA